MLDTIKLGVPLTQKQFNRIQQTVYTAGREQWALFNPTTGELRLRKVTGLAATSQHSFHREIRWDVPSTFIKGETYLTVELSLPKLWYGHNIHLLYEFVDAIAHLKELLEQQFQLKRNNLADVMSWQVWRVDLCYAWKMPSQHVAQQYLESLKHLHYPRKRPAVYPTSIMFSGTTYSVKFYLKLPEFKQHDLKALKKAGASQDWMDHLEAKADGVLRYEATLRRMYLERQGIRTVGDLSRVTFQAVWHEGSEPAIADRPAVMLALMASHIKQRNGLKDNEIWPWVLSHKVNGEALVDGQVITSPRMTINALGRMIEFQGGGFTFKKRDNPTDILRYFLTKFVGEDPAMQHVDEVEAKLLEAYKPVKAAQLVAKWLYVQRFGTAKTKEAFGRDSYYYARREMKKAGVSLVEKPRNVTEIDGNFLRAFKMQIPSPYATNGVDDFRDSDNLLNLIPRVSDG